MAFTNAQIAEYIVTQIKKEENMKPIDKLTSKDKLQILNFIRYNVNEPKVSTDEILTYWNDAKQELFDLFGHELILEKQVQYVKPEQILVSECRDLLADHRIFFNTLADTINDKLFQDVTWWERPTQELMGDSHSWAINKLILNDRHQNSVKIEYNGKSVKFQAGTRQTKTIIKLVEMFCPDLLEEAEEIRLEHSRILNQKKLTGTLCLSIHPLDYMTMSVNDEGWSSCMSWDPSDDGCYKQGTVEMMNSPYVVVAYLKSDRRELEGCGYKWNSKKWRTLMILTKELITTIKGYPYQSSELATSALDFANEMIDYKFGDNSADKIYNYRDNNFDFSIHFSTRCMYNDFGYSDSALMRFNPELYYINSDNQHLQGPDINIKYSGVTECVICGEDISHNYIDEKLLECPDCAGIIGYCADCGDPIFDGDDYAIIDGEYYCLDCVDNNFYWSDITDSYIDSYSAVSVHILAMTPDGKIIDGEIDGGYLPESSFNRCNIGCDNSIYKLDDYIVGNDDVYGYYDDGKYFVLADQPLVPYMDSNDSYVCHWRDMRSTVVPLCEWGWISDSHIKSVENIYNVLSEFMFELENQNNEE